MAAIHRILALLAFTAWLSLTVFLPLVSADCYTPDGEPYFYHEYCESPIVGSMSSCCRHFDLCLDNLLCSHVDDHGEQTYYRGTCANTVDWPEQAECPNFCKGHTAEDSHVGDWPVGKCPADGTSIDRWFCIGNESGYGTVDDCTDMSFGFTLHGDTQPFWTAGITPTYTDAGPTTTGPGTSTRISWKGTGKSTVRSSSTVSADDQPATSTGIASSSSSAVMVTTSSSSSPHDTLLSSSAVDTPLSVSSADHASTSTSDGYLTSPTSSGQSVVATPSQPHDIPATAGETLTSASPPPTLTQPPLIPPHSTKTVQPTPPATATSNSTAAESKVVPVAVGISLGTIVLIAIGCLFLLCVHKRRRGTPARAETPPPYEQDMIPLTPLAPARVRYRPLSFGGALRSKQ